MKIAVLGSGNGGCAVAAECALQGHDVRIFDFEQFSTNIQAIKKANGIECSGIISGFGAITYAGHDIEKAVSGAELIYVVCPSYATVAFAHEYKKAMKKGQEVIICPGTNGGALIFKKEIGLDFSSLEIIVSETSTLPYACRIETPCQIRIFHKLNKGVFFATLPASKTEEAFQFFKEIYPGSETSKNVLQTLLQNGNNVIHPAVSLLNVARIESPEDFFFYEEGVTPAVGRLMEAVDKERMAIANAYDLEILSEPVTGYIQGYMLEKNYDTGYSKAPGFAGINAQTQIDNRYFTEDVGYGLVLLEDMAKVVGVETPIMTSIIKIVSVLLETDYHKNSFRTLDKFGLDGITKDEMLAAVN
ncbi:MAG: NAD/NADP octopine/nopaline dehydrogenase family protein [Flavobacteriaceae bacterium]|nr:NAD/NADP octopine/nopaline dehydrogenase family protein [Flavobacteriaceae bacterium]